MHPFLDGNGRVGRLLITLILANEGVLKEPMLYLSLFLKQHRAAYYDLLQRVRRDGDWEAWLDFFFQGVTEISDGAVATAKDLLALFEVDRRTILGRRAAASALQVHHHLQGHPISSSSAICHATGLTPATVNRALDHLGNLGILKEITGGQRNRLFAYGRVLEVLSEGTEP
jgi:Fic family protein